MVVVKKSTYMIELTPEDAQQLIHEMNTVYPLFAAEGDVDDISTLLNLKDELAMALRSE